MRNLVAAIPLLALAAAGAEPARRPDHVVLVYAADVGGYLEPCGCSADQQGGLARAATALARIRAEVPDTFFVAGGDLLFELPPGGDAEAEDVLRARTLAAALRAMRLDAAVAGERDLYLGERFARSTGLPFTEGTLLGGIVGFGVPGKVPAAPVRVEVVHAGGTRAALPLAAAARRDQIALLLASHRESLVADDFDRAVLDAPVPVVQVRGRGQSLARIDLWLRGDLSRGFTVLPGAAQREDALSLLAERRRAYADRLASARAAANAPLVDALTGKLRELAAKEQAMRSSPLPEPPSDRPSMRITFVPVAKDLPEDRAIRALVDGHYREVAKVNVDRARSGERCPPIDPRRPSYVGTSPSSPARGACQSCHPRAHALWEGTAHARAYATLVRVGRQFDLACVSCHVTGWKQPGGACGITRVAGREGVQCEACHGPGSAHVADPPGHIERLVPAARCRTCHTPEASTHFEETEYRKRILGPGHGQAGN